MGYDVHITRKEDWSDEDDANEITLTEWTDYVKSDNEMRLEDQATVSTENGEKITYVDEGLAVWAAYSKNGHHGNYAWFDYRSGSVSVKNPDEEILKKMVAIARRLNAKVQGDDGEIYGANASPSASKKPWWKIWG